MNVLVDGRLPKGLINTDPLAFGVRLTSMKRFVEDTLPLRIMFLSSSVELIESRVNDTA